MMFHIFCNYIGVTDRKLYKDKITYNFPMVKRELYDLSDEEFGFFVTKVGEELDNRKIPYISVGGTAIQAYVLKGLCDYHNCTVEDLILNDNIRLQDYIRQTDDFDLSLKMPGKKRDIKQESKLIFEVLDSIGGIYESPSKNHILEYTLDRRGMKRPKFRVSFDERSTDEDVIAMNIGTHDEDLSNLDSKYYDLFINKGQNIEIPYGDKFTIKTRTVKPEHLFAAKISNSRNKDIMDLLNLYDSFKTTKRKINFKEVERILGDSHADRFLKFMSLIKE